MDFMYEKLYLNAELHIIIFVLLDTTNMIWISQDSRRGYSSIKTSFNSLR